MWVELVYKLALMLGEPATGFEMREQYLKEAMLSSSSQEAAPKFAEQRGVKASISCL